MKVLDSKVSIKTCNPATARLEKTFEEMNETVLDEILSRADLAYRSWRNTDFKERAALLRNVARLIREQKQELARLCAIEMGKRTQEGIAEVEQCADIFDYYAENGEQFLADEQLEAKSGRAFVSYEPIGVILSVQPWNFPFYQMTRSAAPNVMAGNTIVMKQASNVPQCAQKLEDIFKQAGAPEGVYTNIFVSGSKIDDLIAHPAVKGVAFTGSEKAGSSIAVNAGKRVMKTILELGGSDPMIILDDFPLDEAVKIAAFGRLANAGQICISPKRIIVQRSMYEEFVSKAVEIYKQVRIGDPQDPSVQLGPMVSVEARDKVLKQVADSVAAGARCVYGGKKLDKEGAWMEPTILTDIKRGMPAYDDEVFGPVLCIFAVDDEDQAVDLANDTPFGLGGTVLACNIDRAVQIARRIETGMVYINQVTTSTPELPFGGTKHSGYGREHARDGILEFVNHKLIHLPDSGNSHEKAITG